MIVWIALDSYDSLDSCASFVLSLEQEAPTDSNVGARKQRNIRDNIFVLSAIMNSTRKESEETLDCQVFDIEKCFDSL